MSDQKLSQLQTSDLIIILATERTYNIDLGIQIQVMRVLAERGVLDIEEKIQEEIKLLREIEDGIKNNNN